VGDGATSRAHSPLSQIVIDGGCFEHRLLSLNETVGCFDAELFDQPDRLSGGQMPSFLIRCPNLEGREVVCCRVAPSDCSKGAPTDPDAPVSGIRFLGVTVSLYVAIRHCRVNTLVADSVFISCFPVAVL
jgi:hypothetical protein